MNFDNDDKEAEHDNLSLVQLFCVGDDGCGTNPTDVIVVNYTDRIKPMTDITDWQNCIYPFRYSASDIPDSLKDDYFGRKTYTTNDGTMIAYYFKAFDTIPEIHLRYSDGTQIDADMYITDTDQTAECYVETRLRINRNDFRDFFDTVTGWDAARISSLSLCYAWYYEKDGLKYFQEIYPYTKLNFSAEWLVDLTKAIDFNYQIFY